jgi:hypothetical protein
LKTNFSLLFFFFSTIIFAQTARIKGIVFDEENKPVEGVNISFQDKKTITDQNGFYVLVVEPNVKSNLKFSHVSLKPTVIAMELRKNEDYEFNIVMKNSAETIGEVFVDKNRRKRVEGVTTISPKTVRLIPSANGGVESILKLLPGANSNNELSTQYAVRGGNYDENLVYVNEVEVYRPFLIRSGQQEGLSFANTDLIQSIDFSAGGFQSKYGDKLSSVLDITYRRPKKFGISLDASYLGASLAVENASKDQKWTHITGIRYRDNSMLVKSQQTEVDFRPRFVDVQSYVTYTPNSKWQHGFLGNISQNKYDYRPKVRQTNFGTISEPIALLVYYEGQEKDKYTTFLGAYKGVFEKSENFTLKLIGSAYHTQEQEYFDIFGQYRLGEVNGDMGDEDFGEVEFTRGIGSQLTHARNDLDALIFNAEVKGTHKKNQNQIDWGLKYTRESIRDRIREWEVVDSAGFSLNDPILDFPVNDQPYNPYTGPLAPYSNVRAINFTDIDRVSGYVQWNKRSFWNKHEIFTNIGVRAHQWQVSGDDVSGKSQMTVSPRAQFAIKPDWGEMDILFRLSGGLYHQPPFYRELRDKQGVVQPDVKAQQSVHIVLGNDYSFKMWGRSFKLVSEAYYKSLTDVNPYTLDNVRIRYEAKNNATAYAQGLDLRLNGEFVPGTESWLSFGYLQTEENIENKGFIARPTDQRLKFGILFQDYVPNIPACKVYLNLVYNTGLPGGSPSYADPYDYQLRLRDYRRADVGFSYVFTDRARAKEASSWLNKFKDLSVGLEIFNMFNNQNAITNTWVRDVYTKSQYGVPNYLTSRVFSFKISAKL